MATDHVRLSIPVVMATDDVRRRFTHVNLLGGAYLSVMMYVSP